VYSLWAATGTRYSLRLHCGSLSSWTSYMVSCSGNGIYFRPEMKDCGATCSAGSLRNRWFQLT
jgi:hypothetical protein